MDGHREAEDGMIDIVIPMHNDWDALLELLPELDEAAGAWEESVRVIVVDDGSLHHQPELVQEMGGLHHIREVRFCRLASNLGHQRAIAVGLVEAFRDGGAHAVAVMDCDGEDRPEDLDALLRALRADGERVVVAQRTRRSEPAWFRGAYHLYRLLFRMLTGRRIDFGNFLLIPRRFLESLVHAPGIWNHVASAVIRLRLPLTRVATVRGERSQGRSSMDPTGLVTHGLSAVSVFSDAVFVRVLLFSFALSAATAGGIGAVVGIRLFTDLAIPGWATNAAGLLFIIFLQAVILSAAAAVLLLNARSTEAMVPALDAERYVWERSVFGMEGGVGEASDGSPGEPVAPSAVDGSAADALSEGDRP